MRLRSAACKRHAAKPVGALRAPKTMSNHRYIEYTEAASAIAAAALITYAFLGWMLLAPATRAAGLEGETGFAVFFIGYLTTALLAVILALTIGAHAE